MKKLEIEHDDPDRLSKLDTCIRDIRRAFADPANIVTAEMVVSDEGSYLTIAILKDAPPPKKPPERGVKEKWRKPKGGEPPERDVKKRWRKKDSKPEAKSGQPAVAEAVTNDNSDDNSDAAAL